MKSHKNNKKESILFSFKTKKNTTTIKSLLSIIHTIQTKMGNVLKVLSIDKIFGKLIAGNKKAKILLLGLDAAGKTSLLYKLKLEESIQTIPTIGLSLFFSKLSSKKASKYSFFIKNRFQR